MERFTAGGLRSGRGSFVSGLVHTFRRLRLDRMFCTFTEGGVGWGGSWGEGSGDEKTSSLRDFQPTCSWDKLCVVYIEVTTKTFRGVTNKNTA